jgi:hypothetical protein
VASKDRMDPTHLRPAPCPWRRRRIAPVVLTSAILLTMSTLSLAPNWAPPLNRISSRCCRVRAPFTLRPMSDPSIDGGAVKGRAGRPAVQSKVVPRYIRRASPRYTTKCTSARGTSADAPRSCHTPTIDADDASASVAARRQPSRFLLSCSPSFSLLSCFDSVALLSGDCSSERTNPRLHLCDARSRWRSINARRRRRRRRLTTTRPLSEPSREEPRSEKDRADNNSLP